MTEATWLAVEQYLTGLLVPPDPALDDALAVSETASLPPIAVDPAQGKLLMLLACIGRARAILEIGTLGGYSTIWLARALPATGRLTTLESDPRHAAIARDNIANAGLADLVDIRVGQATDSLAALVTDDEGPFDLVFVDADKAGYPAYLSWAMKLTAPGSVIVFDNVVRDGHIVDGDSSDPGIVATRRLLELLAAEPRISATAIQTVGSKGHDGFAIALVTD